MNEEQSQQLAELYFLHDYGLYNCQLVLGIDGKDIPVAEVIPDEYYVLPCSSQADQFNKIVVEHRKNCLECKQLRDSIWAEEKAHRSIESSHKSDLERQKETEEIAKRWVQEDRLKKLTDPNDRISQLDDLYQIHRWAMSYQNHAKLLIAHLEALSEMDMTQTE